MDRTTKLPKTAVIAIAWLTSVVTVKLAVLAWGGGVNWEFSTLTTYTLFPLLGLIAFSLMLSHYVAGAVRRWAGYDRSVLSSYYRWTAYGVLFCILLHPGLISWQLLMDGQGYPPLSEIRYVDPRLALYVWLGIVAWLCFLAFELGRWASDKRWWKWVQRANDLAMVLIYLHALKLGSNTQTGWYHLVWLLYGVVLAVCLGYAYTKKDPA